MPTNYVLSDDQRLVEFRAPGLRAGVATRALGDFSPASRDLGWALNILKSRLQAENLIKLEPEHGSRISSPYNSHFDFSRYNYFQEQGDGFFDGEIGKGWLALIHCGWRSLSERIIEKTFFQLRTWTQEKAGSFSAFVYGGICRECYTVKNDVKNVFPDHEECFSPASSAKWHMDLGGIIAAKLEALGIAAVNTRSTRFCPAHSRYCDLEQALGMASWKIPAFYSFRARYESGRNAIFAMVPGSRNLVVSTTGDCPYAIIYRA